MILQSIEAWENEQHLYPEAIRRGIDYIRHTDFSRLEPGKYSIDGDDLFALVQEVVTEPASKKRPESHRTYTDIQYLLSGEEAIGACKASARNIVSEDLLDSKDVVFYSQVADETMILLKPGMFTVFYPSDIHRPCCSSGQGGAIRKVVVKIHERLLAAQ